MRSATRTLARLATPGADVARRVRRSPSFRVLGWHRLDIGHGAEGDGLSTPVADFERQLDVLGTSGARVLGLADAIARAEARVVNTPLPNRTCTTSPRGVRAGRPTPRT